MEGKQESKSHESLEEHVHNHVKYPATKDQILTACLAEGFSAEETEIANSHLLDKTYNSADEVMQALHHLHQ